MLHVLKHTVSDYVMKSRYFRYLLPSGQPWARFGSLATSPAGDTCLATDLIRIMAGLERPWPDRLCSDVVDSLSRNFLTYD